MRCRSAEASRRAGDVVSYIILGVDTRTVLLEARGQAGISQRELARRSGVPQAAISRMERGLVSPRVETLDRLLRSCGRDLAIVERPGTGLDRTLIRERLRLTPAERGRLAVVEWANTQPFARAKRL
jgi:transcriptional regulator with XRE-family HTH domain